MTKKNIIRTTEAESKHQNLELLSTRELLNGMNQEDQTVPQAIAKVIPKIEKVVNAAYQKMKKDGVKNVDLNITEEDIVKDISNYDTISK